MENFVLEKMLKNAENFILENSCKNFRKFCNQVARVESSENSEGGCIPWWDMKRPRAVKKRGTYTVPLLDSLENLAFNGFYFCIRD